MEQQEYAGGATTVAAGRTDGRTGGVGTTDAAVAVRPPVRPESRAEARSEVRPGVRAETADGAPDAVPAARTDAAQPGRPADPELSPDPGLLRLAHWFAAATPGTADDLCAASFGLYPARHFGAPASCGPATPDPDVSWWHGPTAHAPGRRARDPRDGGPRRARRDDAQAPVVRSGAKPGRPGRHRRPERARSPQDRSAVESMGSVGAVDSVDFAEAAAQLPDAERRIAARLLLAHPLVTASGPHADGFPLIRRHRDWLTERFDTLLGYRLVVGPWHARLCKSGLGPGSARRLEDPGTGTPFTPAAYAQLALALALLVDAPEQLPYRRLLDAMRAAAPELSAAPADTATALGALAGWQVLGDLPEGPSDTAFVLTVDRELARAVPAGPPALADGPADLIRRAAEAEPATAVRRLLAETPAVLAADLPEDRRAWLHEHRLSGPAALAEFLGLETELRAEGVALLDPAEELTDLALPGTGTLAGAALLLVERLVEEVRPLPGETAEGDVPVADALIDGVLGDIADDHGLPGRYLADRTALRRDALDLLHRLGLITPTPRTTWLLRPPAARYAPAPDLHPTPGTGRHSRRDHP
ncbi:DUF2398 family protein [Kitasatospora sp. NPDC101183]|uniref:DUF2398 family protein n=1 Tax=Kitasatospora sp. NPDC101183 TaxID=3364100 RepID=UPI003820825A